MMKQKDKAVTGLTSGIAALFKANKVYYQCIVMVAMEMVRCHMYKVMEGLVEKMKSLLPMATLLLSQLRTFS